MEMAGGPARDVQDLPYVPGAGQRRLRGGLRLPGACHRQNVRLQEAREEAHQETQGRGHGANREEHPSENQFQVRSLAGIRLRDQGRALPRPYDHERRGSQVSHLQHGRRTRLRYQQGQVTIMIYHKSPILTEFPSQKRENVLIKFLECF